MRTRMGIGYVIELRQGFEKTVAGNAYFGRVVVSHSMLNGLRENQQWSLRRQDKRAGAVAFLESTQFSFAGWSIVLLMRYSVSEDWRLQLIHHFRKHCPQGRIVAIANRQVNDTPKGVDVLVYGVDGPEVLMHAVEGKAAA